MSPTARGIIAVIAGLIFIFAVTTLVDVVLHVIGFYGPWTQPITESQAAVAFAYRVVISIAGCYLTARLAPERPMKYAMILGAIGVVLSAIGAAATWNRALGPHWYPLSLVVISLPCAWVGGKLAAPRS